MFSYYHTIVWHPPNHVADHIFARKQMSSDAAEEIRNMMTKQQSNDTGSSPCAQFLEAIW